jgi:hypothetical protein
MKRNIFLGVVVGCLPYWNVIIAGITLLFLGAFAVKEFKNRNFFFSIMYSVVIGGIIAAPQVMAFKSGSDTVLSAYPIFHPGYALEKFAPIELFLYYLKTLGVKLILIIGAFFLVNNQKKLDFLVFLIPFVIANIFQLGVVLYDNNKLIIIWLVFANCFAAYMIVWLYRRLHKILKFIPVILVISLMLAGFIDLFALNNFTNVTLADSTSPLKQWVVKNTKPEAVFLTNYAIPFDDNSMTSICLGGRKLYVVKNNMDSSINLEPRLETVKEIYTLQGDVGKTKALLKKEKIDYILIDGLVRTNQDFKVKEKEIAENFKLEYQENGVSVYSTK